MDRNDEVGGGVSGAKEGVQDAATSVQEGLEHAGATIKGQIEQLQAKNEHQRSAAQLGAQKKQVDASDKAVAKKKQYHEEAVQASHPDRTGA